MESSSDYLNIFRKFSRRKGKKINKWAKKDLWKMEKKSCLRQNVFEHFVLCDKDLGLLLCFFSISQGFIHLISLDKFRCIQLTKCYLPSLIPAFEQVNISREHSDIYQPVTLSWGGVFFYAWNVLFLFILIFTHQYISCSPSSLPG